MKSWHLDILFGSHCSTLSWKTILGTFPNLTVICGTRPSSLALQDLVFVRGLGHFYYLLHQTLLNFVLGKGLEDGLLHYDKNVSELLEGPPPVSVLTKCSYLCDTGKSRICSVALCTGDVTASTTRFYGAMLAMSASSHHTGDPTLPRSRGIHGAYRAGLCTPPTRDHWTQSPANAPPTRNDQTQSPDQRHVESLLHCTLQQSILA